VPASARAKSMSRSGVRCRTEPRADPPRLGGWMSLARIAQTSDASMSPNRHRRIVSKPIASLRTTPAAAPKRRQRECRCLTSRARNALAPSGLGRDAANVPRRLPSYQESSAEASDRHASPGRSAARRYRAPVRLAYSATLPSRSPSAPAALDGRAQKPKSSEAHPTEMRLADICNPHLRRAPELRMASATSKWGRTEQFTSPDSLRPAASRSRNSC
jgi:hypothetical protein